MVSVCHVTKSVKWCICVRWLRLKWCVCVMWLSSWNGVCVSRDRLWNGACVSGDSCASDSTEFSYSEIALSASDGECVVVHCWAVCQCETACYSTAATDNARHHQHHHRSLSSHKVGDLAGISETWPCCNDCFLFPDLCDMWYAHM